MTPTKSMRPAKARACATPKSRIIFSDPEGPCWETKRDVNATQAIAWARFFAGNRRVLQARAVQRAHGIYRVRIWPASLTGIVGRCLRQCSAKARDEGGAYVFTEAGGAWECWNPGSGKTYVVSASSCTCPHFQTRLRHVGTACKHLEAARQRGLI